MLWGEGPYYTYSFGSLGTTLDTARQTEFFQWFHLEEAEREPEPPGEQVRFRPSGEKFRDLCYLDALTGPAGQLVRLELAVQRAFLDGPEGLFAQDLVKSFLASALPDACRYLLNEFLQELNVPGGTGRTEASLVYAGGSGSWNAETGWSRLRLQNVTEADVWSLAIQVAPNPKAPNAVLIAGPASD